MAFETDCVRTLQRPNASEELQQSHTNETNSRGRIVKEVLENIVGEKEAKTCEKSSTCSPQMRQDLLLIEVGSGSDRTDD